MAETKTDDTEAVQVDSFMNESRLLPRGENMIMAECDEKGRLQLGLALRRRYGSRFVVVEAPDELVLLPVPHGPVKDLEELGKPLEYLPRDEIKRIIDRRARQEVGF